MKKKLFFGLAFAALAAGGCLIAGNHNAGYDLTPEQIANLEALSAYESSYACPGGCMEWSGNDGGGIACDCSHYVGKCKRRCS